MCSSFVMLIWSSWTLLHAGQGQHTTPSLCVIAVLGTGDRGYPLKPGLLTPIALTETAEEAHFNTAHALVRSVVERSIGMLKGRWRCLDASGGRLLYDPKKVCQVILGCCVLHNICVSRGIELAEEKMCMDPDDHPPIPAGENMHITALRRRRELIHQLYQQVNNVDKNKCTDVHIFFNVLFS